MQMTSEATGQLDVINAFLEKTLAGLDTADDVADAEWEKTKARCETKIPADRKKITALQTKLADLEEEKKELQTESTNKTTDLREEENNEGDA